MSLFSSALRTVYKFTVIFFHLIASLLMDITFLDVLTVYTNYKMEIRKILRTKAGKKETFVFR